MEKATAFCIGMSVLVLCVWAQTILTNKKD